MSVAKNRNWVRVDADGRYEFADAVLHIGDRWIVAPMVADFRAAGASPFVDERPTADAQHYAVGTEYADLVDGVYHRRYKLREAVAAPKRYSKLKLYAALASAGLWEPLKTWLETQSFGAVNAYTAFTLAQDLTSDHELFARWLAAAQAALGVSDAAVAQILAAAEEA